jgi:signal transduction histidine kinase
MMRAYAVIDWFIPAEMRYEKSELSLARNFVFTHLFGPLMSQLILVFLHRTDPGGGFPVWTMTVSVWMFWLLPFILRYTGSLWLCAFLSVELLAFVSLFGAFHYGGVTSPFLPWLIVSLLLGCFYLSKNALLVISLFALNFTLFFVAYFTLGFGDRVPREKLELVGWFSIISATVYMAWMAVYYTTMLSMRNELVRETEELAATTKRLLDTKNEAEQANNSRSIFLAKMSHELRTPLNAVIGYSEMILENAEMAAGSEQKKSDLQRINASGKHLLSLVNEVLDLSRIENNEMDIHVESFDMNEFSIDIAAGTDNLVKLNGNKFIVEAAPKMGNATTDATKLRQVCLNLLSNAAKFTKDGTITLVVRRDRSSVGDWIEIQVKDTGIGIAADDLNRLFSNFIQASASTSSRFGGTGLGLAHSQKLCGLLGGRISVASEPAKGSVFTIKLPTNLNAIEKRKLNPAEPSTVVKAA